MSELSEFIERGSRAITPASVRDFRRHLPALQLKLLEIDSPNHPHLVNQAQFLARFVEDVADHVYGASPYVTYAEALFALSYLLKTVDIIPDSVPEIGYADDSGVVRYVLEKSEAVFQRYAAAMEIDWTEITTEP